MIRAAAAERSLSAVIGLPTRWQGSVPSTETKDVRLGADAMTLAMVFIPNDVVTSEVVLHDTANLNAGGYRTFLGYNISSNGGWRFFTPNGAPSRANMVPVNVPVTVVLTVDKTSFQLYVNGEPMFVNTTQTYLRGDVERIVRLGGDNAGARLTFLPYAAAWDQRRVTDSEALNLHRWLARYSRQS